MLDSHKGRATHLPLIAVGVLLLLMGLAMLAGGIRLVTLGGSWYYLLAGVGIALSGALAIAKRRATLWLYALTLFASNLWALWEVGLDWWQLVPRLSLWFVFGILLLLPWVRRPLVAQQSAPLATAALSVAVVLAGATALASQFTAPGTQHGEIAERAPQRVDPAHAAGDDWPAYGATNAGTHYSSLGDITPENVTRLEEAWRIQTGDLPGSGDPGELTSENTPLKVNDTLYLCTPHSQVLALDPASGATKWRFDPELSLQGAKDFSGWAHMTCRGVAYHDQADYPAARPVDARPIARVDAQRSSAAEDTARLFAESSSETANQCPRQIFLPTADGRLISLDADSGERCEAFGEHGEVDLTRGLGAFTPGGYYATSPPVVTRDLVIIGGHVTDNESTDEPSGVVRAYDVRDGHLVWNWDSGNPDATTPLADGERYTRNSPNVWSMISADERLGLVYLPVGNQMPDQYGAERSEGAERYSAGLVALDLATGQVRWHQQLTHHDLWDMDVPAQPILTDVATPDGMRPAVIQPTKQGSLYVFDRRNGEPIIPVDEIAAPQGAIEGDHTAPTQPRSRLNLLPPELTEASMWGATPFDQLMCRIAFKSLRYEGQYTPPSLEGSIVYPGNVGVFNWGGVAVDPARQAIFSSPNYMAFTSRLVPRAEVPADSAQASEGNGLLLNLGAPYAVEMRPFLSRLGFPCQAPSWGDVAGVDLAESKVVWKRPNGTSRDSSPIVPLPFNLGVPAMGGPMTTAGGVSFLSGTLDQYLRAYDITTGKELWKARLPAGGQATPMSYRGADGRQYVLVTVGGHGSFGTKMGDYVIAYALPETP